MEPIKAASEMSSATPRGMGRTIGESGTQIMGGIITGEEYNTRLQGKHALRMFDIMRRSEESVRAALQIVKLPLINQTNSIEGYDDSEDADFRARFLERELFHRNIDFKKVKREGLTFGDFGHAVAEVTYELTTFEGRTMIGIKEIGFRKQTSIEAWETRQGQPGIQQMLVAPQDGKDNIRDIIRQKLIVWTNDQEGDNYEGVSLLRYAFKSWDMADKLGIVHAMGLEKMAIPTPVLGVPSNANKTDEAEAVEALQQYRANQKSFIKKPAGWELDKFDMSGQSLAEMLPALQHYETKIMLSVLGQFLMLGLNSSGSGSRAVSEDHSKLFMLSEEAFSETFNSAIQRDLIQVLESMNYSDVADTGFSQLRSSAVREDDVQILADAVQKLKSAGMLTPTFETENHFRKMMKVPELPEDYEEDYEKRREMANNPIDPMADPQEPGKSQPVDDPTLEDSKTKAAVIANAQQSQRQLAGLLLGSHAGF